MRIFLVSIIAYVIGSVSFSLILSRVFFRSDVREGGSGNAGATNMARLFGMDAGLATLALDAAKGALALFIGRHFAGPWGMCAAGISCLLGHCFPVFSGFRGGKGVAVGLAAVLAADWRVCLGGLVVFALCAALSKKVSLSSIVASAFALLGAVLLKLPADRLVLIAVTVLIIIVQHRENISRLLHGTEKDFSCAGAERKHPKKHDNK